MDWTTGIVKGPFSETQGKQLVESLSGLSAGQAQWLSGYFAGISPLLETPLPAERQDETAPSTAPEAKPVYILYGTHTGNSERLAGEAAKRIKAAGRAVKVSDMDSFKIKELSDTDQLLIIVSTDGDGEPPVQAEDFLQYLQSSKARKLDHLSYSILALGDTSYTYFCKTGKDFEEALEKLNASSMVPRIDCDVDFEDDYERWIKEVITALGQLSVSHNGLLIGFPGDKTAPQDGSPRYDRKHPFSATVLQKIKLNGRGSTKETYHLELDLGDSGLRYEPGDALGIYALNSNRLVDGALGLLQASGEELVESYRGPKTLKDALMEDYELTPLTAVSLRRHAEITGNKEIKEILADDGRLKKYLHGRDILDFIAAYPADLSPEIWLSLLRKNTPRMYSIASSQGMVGDEVHVLVSAVRYSAHGRSREGHCSSFLADRIQEGDQVGIFVDPNTRFRLPADPDAPVIMVGPGTGIAPYRAFIQERASRGDEGKSWLFFGERNFTTDFLYQAEWLRHLKEGTLTRASVAFSRDQREKVYVQHKMLEHGKELFDWLENGAHFYVCGDREHMAKDVDKSLSSIIREYGGMSPEKAAAYIKTLQHSGRYQSDVY
ncbi:assimilatory sulfite reductase (NADPH) flavoprotein subunit [Compostibacter hankyongensis]|uniref:Assimilatory sulfite reductase (NADPH) flavoprotein subunit n=1 Tax=Compostibacter hankyongensis TaxID=1007089 RepID=A0ABP8FCT3_9BACT